jgi:hypothetical protein
MHTITLIARWYISGHAPGVCLWSNCLCSLGNNVFWFSFDIKSLTVASAAFVTNDFICSVHELDWSWNSQFATRTKLLLVNDTRSRNCCELYLCFGMILGFVALLIFLPMKRTRKNGFKHSEITISTSSL